MTTKQKVVAAKDATKNTLAVNAKAVAAGLVAGLFTLIPLITGNETFSDVTTGEWLYVVGAVVTGTGFTWLVPNRTDA